MVFDLSIGHFVSFSAAYVNPEPRGWRQKTPNPRVGKRGTGVESLMMSSSKICDKGLGLLESRVYRGASIYYVIKEWEGGQGSDDVRWRGGRGFMDVMTSSIYLRQQSSWRLQQSPLHIWLSVKLPFFVNLQLNCHVQKEEMGAFVIPKEVKWEESAWRHLAEAKLAAIKVYSKHSLVDVCV